MFLRSRKKLLSVVLLFFLLCLVWPGLTLAEKPEATEKEKPFSDKIPLTAKNLELFTWRHIGPWPFS
ncbi:MAG: hypothetical protein H5U07_11660, partial [Candidatus Aminicenantes bacterium]|nr:hypothetical protein [Candidatus Aminicenantes bacterium]